MVNCKNFANFTQFAASMHDRCSCMEACHASTLDASNGNFLLLRPYHGEHGPKVPGVHRFAAGAAKTGVSMMHCVLEST
jgi:hypothetical protein